MANFDFLKGNIEIIILNALFLGDKYGYEISRIIKDKTNQQYEIKQATLYGYLKRLEEQQLIQSYWGEQSNGGRRKYFTLTDSGKVACKEFTAEWNYHKNVLENLVSDEITDDDSYVPDKQFSRDRFFGSKSPRAKVIKSNSEIKSISEELKKLTAEPQSLEDEASGKTSFDFGTSLEVIKESDININFSENIFRFDKTEQITPSQPTSETLHKLFEETQASSSDDASDESKLFNYSQNEAAPEPVEQNSFINDNLYDLFQADEDPSPSKSFDAHEAKPTQKQQQPLPRIPNTAPSFDADTLAKMRKSFAPEHNADDSTNANSDAFSIKQTSINFTQFDREAENQKYYKSALGELLDDQITDTDTKVEQLSKGREKTYTYKEGGAESTIIDLAEELAKEGVKMRFYNSVTSQYRAVPMLLKNKIRCATAWAALFVFFASSIIASLKSSNFITAIIASLGFSMIPVVYTMLWRIKPYLQIKPNYNFKFTLINRLVFFVLSALFVLCFDLILLKTNFSDSDDLFKHFLLPFLVLAMAPVSELIYACFLKFKTFYN